MEPTPTEVAEQAAKFRCKVCGEKFNNPQALGTHQNKHRVELAQAKREQNAQTAQATQQRLQHQQQQQEEEDEEVSSIQYCSPNAGLCVLCMRTKPLGLAVDRPNISPMRAEAIRETSGEEGAAEKRRRADFPSNVASTGKTSMPVEITATFGGPSGSQQKEIEELDLTLRLGTGR